MSGLSSVVHRFRAVVKQAKPDCLEELRVECAILTHLGRHPRIVDAYYIPQEEEKQNVIVLEELDMSLRQLLQRPNSTFLSNDQVLNFAEQITDGYNFLHSKGVYHVDIGAHNMLIDKSHSNLKLCDFASSSMNGSEPMGCAGIRAQCPWSRGPSIETEIFALGSLFYELSTGHEAYMDIELSTIQDLFRRKQFPATSHLILGPVMHKCWTGQYKDTEGVLEDLRSIRRTNECRQSELPVMRQQGMKYGSMFRSVAVFVRLSKKSKFW